MDWPTIHAYAEEVELWTTLTINLWVLIGAILFAWRRLWTEPKSTIGQELISIAREATFSISVFVSMGGMLLVGTNKSPFNAAPFWTGVALIVVGCFVISTYFGWTTRGRKPPDL